MKLWGVTEAELVEIVEKVSAEHYDGNVQINYVATHGKRVEHVVFTLRTRVAGGPGSKPPGHGGRRSWAASWEAHRDVMREIFERHPGARLWTAIADYRGKADFDRNHEATRPEHAAYFGGN